MDSVDGRQGFALYRSDDRVILAGKLYNEATDMDQKATLWVWCSVIELADLVREWHPFVHHGSRVIGASYDQCNVVYPQGAFALYCYLQELKDGQS